MSCSFCETRSPIKHGDTPETHFGTVRIFAAYEDHFQVERLKRSIRGILPDEYGMGQDGPNSRVSFLVFEDDVLLLLRLLRNENFTHTEVEFSPLEDPRWEATRERMEALK